MLMNHYYAQNYADVYAGIMWTTLLEASKYDLSTRESKLNLLFS